MLPVFSEFSGKIDDARPLNRCRFTLAPESALLRKIDAQLRVCKTLKHKTAPCVGSCNRFFVLL